MTPKELYENYLQQGKVMQLATLHDGRPWICSVYYIAEQGKIYWLSWPSRQHSQDIAAHATVAAAIVIQPEQPVVGVQLQGEVCEISDIAEVTKVMDRYVARHNAGHGFVARLKAGTNQHVLYCCTPQKAVIFDEAHFPGDARKEIEL